MPYGRYARRGRSSRSRGYRPNRRVVWYRGIASAATTPVPIGSQGVNLLPEDAGIAGGLDPGARLGATVMRVRGALELSTATGTGFKDNRFTWGITVAPLDSVPQPEVDRNRYQWLTWSHLAPWNQTYEVLIQATNAHWAVNFDVKAKRVITQPAETLLAMFQPVSTMPAANWVDWAFSWSVLLKLA